MEMKLIDIGLYQEKSGDGYGGKGWAYGGDSRGVEGLPYR